MLRVPVFISFDYDHDNDLKNALVGQARMDDSPFEIADWSIKNTSPAWQSEARGRIRRARHVIILCGEYTHTAQGVGVEVAIAREEQRPHFLLWGRADRTCRQPPGAEGEPIYGWTWENLKNLIAGWR